MTLVSDAVGQTAGDFYCLNPGGKGREMETPVFKIGDTVVEPTIGICRVQGIKQITVDGSMEDFYMFQAPNAQVMVPRSQLAKRGIRRPMSKEEIKKVIGTLRVPVSLSHGDAREQYLEYQDTLRSGDPTKISKLLRRLFILDQSDDLKGKEKELMEKARKFLVDEITFIQGSSKTKIVNDINESLRQMYKKRAKDEKEEKVAAAKGAAASAAKEKKAAGKAKAGAKA